MTTKFQIPMQNPHITLREETDDWGLLFDPDTRKVYGINPMGIWIWKQINGMKTVQEIASDIRESFSDFPENIEDVATEFVDSLATRGYVTMKE